MRLAHGYSVLTALVVLGSVGRADVASAQTPTIAGIERPVPARSGPAGREQGAGGARARSVYRPSAFGSARPPASPAICRR